MEPDDVIAVVETVFCENIFGRSRCSADAVLSFLFRTCVNDTFAVLFMVDHHCVVLECTQ